ncbi:MAG: uridine kinase [Chloroflexi bacterium RBG_19FT_COMBO_47_9]|nr:MAG: uridine kinase [Chloroflexi bacterium RBG_19FT_COMBO_47_9]
MDKANPSEFEFVTPRPTVEIHLPDGRVICGLRGSAVGNFLSILETQNSPPMVGAIINSELRELTFPIHMDAKVIPISMDDTDGMLIYRRSLTFLLEAAFEELFPDATLTIDHSVSSGGYYCEVKDHSPLSDDDLASLTAHMRSIVEENLPFTKREVPLAEAVAYFEAKDYTDKVRLLAHRQKDYLTLYRLGDHQDYHHGYMVPSTGYLRWFNLIPTNGGFTINFPRRNLPTQLQPMPNYPKLLATFRRYGQWLDRLGIASVGALNDSILAGRIHEIILVSEALHEEHVADIAEQITSRYDQSDTSKKVRIILIAGPSSSGKTTLSKRLTIQLLSQGISPFPLEMDNYFVEREDTPKDENGQPDFEALQAVDTRNLTQDLRRLVAGEAVRMPRYNFKSGRRDPGDLVQLQPGQVIILEGIHGLNPELLPNFPVEQTFRIYASALTQLNLDRHNRISTTDTRLVRRIVRDAQQRGYTARETIQRWESVQKGEKCYIFPFQENADIMFNSALAYELSALKPYAEPLLRQVPFGTREYIEAKRMLALLEWFQPVSSDLIPDNSILREFIGGSILKEFKLWNPTQ